MNTEIIASRSEDSGRTAIVHEEVDSVWLYLSRPGEARPDVSCWVLNTLDAPPVPDFAVYRSQSAPPPLPRAQVDGEPPDPRHGRWSLLWSPDGNAVTALLDDQPIAFVVGGHSRGYARHVKAGATPWALPWDEKAFAAAFERF